MSITGKHSRRVRLYDVLTAPAIRDPGVYVGRHRISFFTGLRSVKDAQGHIIDGELEEHQHLHRIPLFRVNLNGGAFG